MKSFHFENAFEQGRLLFHAHHRRAVGVFHQIAGVEHIARQQSDKRQFRKDAIHQAREGAFFRDEVRRHIVGVMHLVSRLPQRAHAFALDSAQFLPRLRILHAVGRIEVDDAIGLDGVKQLVLLFVGENADVFFELEQLLLDVGDRAILFVAD